MENKIDIRDPFREGNFWEMGSGTNMGEAVGSNREKRYQEGLPVKGGEYQHTHKSNNPKFILPTRYSWIIMEQRLRE